MGKLLDLKLQIDHRLLEVVDVWRAAERIKLSALQRRALNITDEKFKNKAIKKNILICGNGPSLEEINFHLFNNVPVITANFFYKHKLAHLLSPEYYVIIDGKIMSGVWPVTMIDEIFDTIPSTELFLDVRWLGSPILKAYEKKGNINWVLPNLLPHAYLKPRKKLSSSICGLNVVAAAIGIATTMGYSNLGIAGVDGDGLFREILDRPSHFYEGAKDISTASFESMVKSLLLSTENLWAWHGIVQTHSAKGIFLYNLCKGGIMDCMPRINQSEFLAKEIS